MFKLAGGVIILLFTITACTIISSGAQEVTPSPEPTSSIPDMQVVSAQACQVAEQVMIRVDQPQGDLISWSPTTDSVAYVAATQESSWNVGEMNILSAPRFDEPVRLVNGVAGELTWSPNGTTIAYLELRRSDDLYTIGLAYPDGQLSIDLFPDEAARTDDYSSQKTILEWTDSSHLRVLVSCGEDCLQTLDISVPGGLMSQVGIPFHRYWNMWAAHTNQPAILPTEYADLPGQLNWSWDDQHIAYIDERGNAWVINAESDTLYPLDIGQYGTATETDWSYDNQYLAVQVDQTLMIFSFNCP